MGGPTGEIHAVDPQMGAFGEKVQEVLFVKEEELEGTDKTRKALVRSSFHSSRKSTHRQSRDTARTRSKYQWMDWRSSLFCTSTPLFHAFTHDNNLHAEARIR